MTVTANTANNAEAILDSLYRNAVQLAKNAQGRDEVTDEEIERAWYVLATEMLERDDTRKIAVEALVVGAGVASGSLSVDG